MGAPAMVGGGGLIVLIIGAIFTLLNGGNVNQGLQPAGPQLQQQQAQQAAAGQAGAAVDDDAQEETKKFVGFVLKQTEDVWNKLFQEQVGKPYQEPKLVLFTGAVQSACGSANAAVGPFYCPGDSKVYLDTSFFHEMRTKFGAPGDFACAYVIAHEIGHHVQNQLGLSMKVQREQAKLNKADSNRLSVRLELQADFLAGVWAHHAQKMNQILEPGDIGEALNAAKAIGDDTLQRKATGHVRRDAFTHGTSEQRIRWFTYGLKTGDFNELNLLFEKDYREL